MGMAKRAAKLFTDNLKYSNGEPVKVVIADTTIGRVAEAAACASKFKKEGVDITLTVPLHFYTELDAFEYVANCRNL